MRFPVFSKHSNPAIDQPIIRKSLSYLEGLVRDGLAVWVSADSPRAGVIARSRFERVSDVQEIMKLAAGSGFDSAWAPEPSGNPTLLVWQMDSRA